MWIAGRVKFPEDTPADEQVMVVARGKAFPKDPEGRREHEVELQADGRFRVAVSPETKVASLLIRGVYLHLDEPYIWKADSAETADDIVLEPLLGTMLEVQFLVPQGASPELKNFKAVYRGPNGLRGQYHT